MCTAQGPGSPPLHVAEPEQGPSSPHTLPGSWDGRSLRRPSDTPTLSGPAVTITAGDPATSAPPHVPYLNPRWYLPGESIHGFPEFQMHGDGTLPSHSLPPLKQHQHPPGRTSVGREEGSCEIPPCSQGSHDRLFCVLSFLSPGLGSLPFWHLAQSHQETSGWGWASGATERQQQSGVQTHRTMASSSRRKPLSVALFACDAASRTRTNTPIFTSPVTVT